MRPVHLFDLDQVTRAVMGVPGRQQARAVDRIIAQATTADRFRKRLRRSHPQFGAGTLADAIDLPLPDPGPVRCDTAYLRTLTVVVSRLLAARDHDHSL